MDRRRQEGETEEFDVLEEEAINYGTELLSWRAREYEVQPKSAEWYWALGILAAAGVIAALIFNNILLAIIIAVGAFVFAIAVSRPLPEVECKITPRGILVGHDFYPFSDLEAYWIHLHDPRDALASTLLLRHRSVTQPLIAIPLADSLDPRKVDAILREVLPAQEMYPPIMHRLLEWMGV